MVVGASAAATAAAWFLSSAAVSADTIDPPAGSITPVTDAAVAGMHDASGGVSELLDAVSDPASPDRPALLSRPGHTGGPATESAPGAEPDRAAHQIVLEFADHAVVQPVARTVGAAEHVLNRPEDAPEVIEEAIPKPEQVIAPVLELLDPHSYDSPGELPDLPGLTGPGQDDAPAGYDPQTAGPVPAPIPAELPALPGLVFGPSGHDVIPPVAVKGALPASADEDVPTDNGVDPSAPIRAPIAPPAAPTGPGGFAGGGTHTDAVPSSTVFSAAVWHDAHAAGSVRPSDRFGPVEPGTQPGVTPD